MEFQQVIAFPAARERVFANASNTGKQDYLWLNLPGLGRVEAHDVAVGPHPHLRDPCGSSAGTSPMRWEPPLGVCYVTCEP
jgi:hypothetical protein